MYPTVLRLLSRHADNATLTCVGGCKDGYSSHGGGAGIGANVDCQYGNIIINSGTIYAEGAKGGAGIGACWGDISRTPGKITINGGNVTAKGKDYQWIFMFRWSRLAICKSQN